MVEVHHAAKKVMGGDDIDRSLTRVAYEIVERNKGTSDLILLGIPTRGEYLAERLGEKISTFSDPVAVGALDITMYRDDLHRSPLRTPQPTRIPEGGIDGKTIILIDDVLYTGRTIRAALDALGDIGRPRAVQLAVLVDRGHRELPIRADFVGKNLPTSSSESVAIFVSEVDGDDRVEIRKEA